MSIRRITSLKDLEQVLAESQDRPVWLLKHSLICPLSSEGLRQFESFVAGAGGGPSFVIVEVQDARDVSDEIAGRLGVRHETPQALLVIDGRARWHASHWAISQAALEDAERLHAPSMDETSA